MTALWSFEIINYEIIIIFFSFILFHILKHATSFMKGNIVQIVLLTLNPEGVTSLLILLWCGEGSRLSAMRMMAMDNIIFMSDYQVYYEEELPHLFEHIFKWSKGLQDSFVT